jgi:hypothetical protein
MPRIALVAGIALVTSPSFPAVRAAAPTQAGSNSIPRTDPAGNPVRRAPTGHISNYDESKVGDYTLPDPLTFGDGTRVTDAAAWQERRRPEIIRLYESEIYGRVPENAPRITWELAESGSPEIDGKAIRKEIIGRFGTNTINVHVVLPAQATNPVPLLLHLTFFGASPVPESNGTNAPAQSRSSEAGPVRDILARGFGYATVRYTDFEGDSRTGCLSRARRMALPEGHSEVAPDAWGTISTWAWGASRVLDYLETDRAIDSKRVALIGHSRLGKTALWAGAQDTRFALVFSSCSGEMGAALARRDFGETVDDMAANFPWQFAGNFQKYSGRWNEMPVDAHMLIALMAPRPVFITGGTTDQWADPRGQFLAAAAAEPVYQVLGKPGIGTKELPPLDTPLINGTIGFLYHTGGHTITVEDWKAFLEFARRNLGGSQSSQSSP